MINRLHCLRVYVEVMHTNAYVLGFGEPLGDADFFPNYGSKQPGCEWDFFGACSHKRAPEYFAESINVLKFIAKKCKSFHEIGSQSCTDQLPQENIIMHPQTSNFLLQGIFFLRTNSNSMYGLGNKNY